MDRIKRSWLGMGLLAGVMLLGSSGIVTAQDASDGWQVTIAPYLMAAGLSGTTGIGRVESDVKLSASDVFSNLQFGFMGYMDAKKGKWGVGADIIWMALGSSVEGPLPANIDVDQGGFSFLALRELSPYADLRAGITINTLHPIIAFKAPINRDLSRDETWVDPVVGINLHTPQADRRWGVTFMADIGGFGAGSKFMYNLNPLVWVRVSTTAGLAFGYRVIYLNYENEGDDEQRRFLYKMTSSGPTLGFIFRF